MEMGGGPRASMMPPPSKVPVRSISRLLTRRRIAQIKDLHILRQEGVEVHEVRHEAVSCTMHVKVGDLQCNMRLNRSYDMNTIRSCQPHTILSYNSASNHRQSIKL